ncbi:hypothetical protein EZS27_027366 [termite gut metagenome]|uniref:DUF3822 family protein n=1 Tax=termite gut metagenome TaxID=433724 RepID=A0A5J4QPY3_9ZZZZ
MPERAISDIDFNQSEQLILSIRLGTDGFSFTIHSSSNKQPEAFLHKETMPSLPFIANLKQLFSELDFLGRSYKQIRILWVSSRFTIVPLSLFDEKQVELIFGYTYLRTENEIVLYNILKGNDTVLLFGIDKNVYQYLIEQYPQANVHSHITPLIDYFSGCDYGAKKDFSRKMYIALYEQRIDICCFEYKRLIFINSFEYQHIDDCIYYILHIWKQMDLNQETNKLYLTGTIPDKERLMRELKSYILNVHAIKTKDQIPVDMQTLSV